MSRFKILGGKPLEGEIAVKGAKNAALKLLPASLLISGKTVIKNVPNIEDVNRMVEIMKDLGVSIDQRGSTYTISNTQVQKAQLHPQLHQKVRTSILLACPILLQKGEVDFPYPGGCVLGKRPIDFFLEGFKKFGITVEDREDGYTLRVQEFKPATIIFPRISVTGTEAMMMLASRIPGKTLLVNAAVEPEIPALANFLNSCGAKISGAGTSTITIEGVKKLTDGEVTVIPDRIEAGTFVALGLATKSHIKVTGIIPEHLQVLWELLRMAGAEFQLGKNYVEVFKSPNLVGIPKDLVTHEYPGLPTDLQPPLTVLMTQAKGSSLIFETIYEGRLFYTDSLNSMGANIFLCDPHRALIMGPSKLVGKKIASPDIRAGIALVIAGLAARGTTEIDNIYQIDRGYEKIDERLRALGARIERLE